MSRSEFSKRLDGFKKQICFFLKKTNKNSKQNKKKKIPYETRMLAKGAIKQPSTFWSYYDGMFLKKNVGKMPGIHDLKLNKCQVQTFKTWLILVVNDYSPFCFLI